MQRRASVLLSFLFAPLAIAGPIAIAVADASGEPVPSPYAAIVPADSPWRSPAAETAGAPVRFDVPPGVYRLVVGAPGFQNEWREQLVVGAEPQTLRIMLNPLAPVAGRVVDRQRNGVAKARVAAYFDRLPSHPRELSSLGQRHLQANLVALSDADGYFMFAIPPSRTSVILIEADGMAPKIVDAVSAGSNQLAEVVLERGASLNVRLDAATAETRVELMPVRTALDASLPAHRAMRLWRRDASDASWSSLPAGTYEIAVRERLSSDPIVIARVELATGEARSLALPAPSEPPAAASVVIIAKRDAGMTVTRWRQGASGAARFEWRDGDRLAVDDCRSGDVFVLTTPTRVGSVAPERCDGTAIDAAMHDRASLQLRFEAAVQRGIVTAHSCDGDTVRMRIPFAAEDRQALVPFPGGCSAVSVAADGFRRIDAGRVTSPPEECTPLRYPTRARPRRCSYGYATAIDCPRPASVWLLSVPSSCATCVRSTRWRGCPGSTKRSQT